MIHVLLPYVSLYKHHKWMLLLGIALTIVTLLSSVGLLSISGWFLSVCYMAGKEGLYSFNYILPTAAVRLASMFRTVGKYFERLVSHDVTFRILQNLRICTFKKLLPLFPSKLMHFRQGELLNCIIADVNTLDHFYLRVLSPIIGSFLTIIVIILGLSILDLTSALTLGFIMLGTFFLFPLLFYRSGKNTGESLNRLRGEYRQKLTSWLQGQAELILFGACKHYRRNMENIEFNWNKEQYDQSKLISFSQVLMILINGIAVLAMLWVAEDSIKKGCYFNEIVSIFVFCSFSMFEVLVPISNTFQYLGQVISSATFLSNILNQVPEVHFGNTHSVIPLQVSLDLNEVSFSYEERMQNALENVTLSIKKGTHIALLGRTGCGKSTLLYLLTRSWNPKKGSITLNDTPLHQFSEEMLRSIISIMPQRVHLFSASLRDNLLLSPFHNIEDRLLYAVLERVGLKNLIDNNSLNDWFGEGGRLLSGGELRRFAIARVILRNSPLILLDEPTEGLDGVTEKQIIKLIREVFREKTLLMVTHRLYGLSSFDKILIMDNGKIIEEGNHIELLSKKGLYYKFKQRL